VLKALKKGLFKACLFAGPEAANRLFDLQNITNWSQKSKLFGRH
jgi:hypothetical protein